MADDAKKDEGDKSNENNKKQNPDITPLEKQPQWIQLQEKAKQRAIQFTHDPNLDQFAKDFIIASLAENTLRAYAFDAKIFRLWCELRNVPYLPASPVTVANFLAAEATQKPPLKAATIIRSHNDPKKPDLSAQVVALVVKKYVAKLGLDPDYFAGHSLRRGFITSGVRKGRRIEKLIAVTHQTPRTLLNYYEDIHQFDDHAGEGLL